MWSPQPNCNFNVSVVQYMDSRRYSTWTAIALAGCGQLLYSTSWSRFLVCCCCVSRNVYRVTASSSFSVMGVIPVSMHSASADVVRYALAIFKLISRCTRTYLCLLCSYFIASFHTGAPYVSKGRMALCTLRRSLHSLAPKRVLLLLTR